MKTKKHIRIYIVEDNKIFSSVMRADIESAFSGMSMSLQTFETGEKCMAQFRVEKPQIVILDYHLNSHNPDAADGIKVLDWIKRENPETNVIILTGDDNVDIALKSFKHGASDYVVKSDTQFRKIIFSLFNLIRMMEANTNAKRYRRMAIGIVLFIVLIIGSVLLIQIFEPSLLQM